jgi:hypothetical protein
LAIWACLGNFESTCWDDGLHFKSIPDISLRVCEYLALKDSLIRLNVLEKKNTNFACHNLLSLLGEHFRKFIFKLLNFPLKSLEFIYHIQFYLQNLYKITSFIPFSIVPFVCTSTALNFSSRFWFLD